ncbi:MAG: acyl-CoA dehydrogenase family protein [Dehalococcoidia bacterium]|nr:MAG: acyl-CoA dehydrogenase family protein [Dehalococcoidia bacterium]
MDFRFTVEEEAFREEVREWLKKEIPPRWIELDAGLWEETEESWALSREFQRKLGQKGWLAPAYPREYGGSEMGHIKRLVLSEELNYNRAPISIEVEISVNWAGQALMLFGSEEQKREVLSKVGRGEAIFCLGYSEPNAGSDLASLQTRAVEDGDSWVINGQKIWCSYAHYADYCWLGARTDPDAPKHKGISMFLVDMKTPGITVRPLINVLNRHSFNEVFFDDVRIPRENLVGEENNGWYQLVMALDFERSLIGTAAAHQRFIDELVHYMIEAKGKGERFADDPLIKDELAEIAVQNEVLRMMCYRIAWMYSQNLHPSYESSMSLLFSSELLRRIANVGMRVVGPYGQLDTDSKWSVLKARVMRAYLASLSIGVGGGSNEIQRNIVAMRGLGLPRQ